jgi:hypothetical protein
MDTPTNGKHRSILYHIPGNKQDTWDRIVDYSQITDILIGRNQKHFGQAHGTPFTVPTLSNWVGWHGTSELVDAVHQG